MAAKKKSRACVAFGNAVRAVRTEHGISQEALAHEHDFHRSYLGAVERGEFNVSLDMILKLAGSLDMTGAELLRRARL